MKIAILGTRGVPPNYGGFETFAAELSTRLVQRGHEVFVYCRQGAEVTPAPRALRAAPWNGVHRIVLPAIGHKYLETVSHAFLSALDALRRDFDAVLVCNAANAFVVPLLRAARIPAAINVDGIERRRRKWNFLGRAVYAIGETFSIAFANRVVADAEVIARYYRKHYAFEPVVIPYGSDFPPGEEDSDVLARLGLEPRGYILYVSRFEPENNPLEVVSAYEKQSAEGRAQGAGGAPAPPDLRSAPPLVMLGKGLYAAYEKQSAEGRAQGAGGAPAPRALRSAPPDRRSAPPDRRSAPPLVMLGKGLYAADLVRELHARASDRVLFPGALYGRDYRTLQRNALVYIQATEVGGTHPAMIEAMGSGGAVLAHDTPENREVGGDAAGYFRLRPEETLSGILEEWLADGALRDEMRERARRRAAERYSWERVTDAYERLFVSLSRGF